MLKLGNIDIGGVFLGGTEIAEAYLGSQLVYSSGWPCVPQNGVIVDGATVSSEITASGYATRTSFIQITAAQTATFSGVVFGKKSTTLSINYSSSTYKASRVNIDGVRMDSVDSIDISAYADGLPHTIEIRAGTTAARINGMSFNVK